MTSSDNLGYSNVMAAFSMVKEREKTKDEIRVIVKVIEEHVQKLMLLVHDLDKIVDISEFSGFCEKVREIFVDIRSLYAQVQEKVPPGQYYKYHEVWKHTTKRVMFVAALVTFFESQRVLDVEGAAEFLGVHVKQSDGFHIDLSSFFLSLLQLAEYLARFSTFLVINAQYGMTEKIALFIAELSEGFNELNFKNDIVRRKYDGLKYHLKHVREISLDMAMYDLKTRGPH